MPAHTLSYKPPQIRSDSRGLCCGLTGNPYQGGCGGTPPASSKKTGTPQSRCLVLVAAALAALVRAPPASWLSIMPHAFLTTTSACFVMGMATNAQSKRGFCWQALCQTSAGNGAKDGARSSQGPLRMRDTASEQCAPDRVLERSAEECAAWPGSARFTAQALRSGTWHAACAGPPGAPAGAPRAAPSRPA